MSKDDVSVPVRALQEARAQAFLRGDTMVPLDRLGRRTRRGEEAFAHGGAEEKEPSGMSFSGVRWNEIDTRDQSVPGAALLQDSPGIVRSRARKTRRDPRKLRRLVSRFVAAEGWETMLDVAEVASQWGEIVGEQVAAHCHVESFDDRRLVVRATSTAWATQLRYHIPTLMGEIAKACGPGIIDTIVVLGPQQPTWRHGRRTVRGRGPRDTYG